MREFSWAISPSICEQLRLKSDASSTATCSVVVQAVKAIAATADATIFIIVLMYPPKIKQRSKRESDLDQKSKNSQPLPNLARKPISCTGAPAYQTGALIRCSGWRSAPDSRTALVRPAYRLVSGGQRCPISRSCSSQTPVRRARLVLSANTAGARPPGDVCGRTVL